LHELNLYIHAHITRRALDADSALSLNLWEDRESAEKFKSKEVCGMWDLNTNLLHVDCRLGLS
jgi:hypothetical protein